MMDAIRLIPCVFILLLIGVCIRFSGVFTWMLRSKPHWAFASLAAHVLAGFCLFELYVRVLPDPGNGDVLKYLLDAGFLNDHLSNSAWWHVISGVGTPPLGEQWVLEEINHWELSDGSVLFNEGRTLIRLHMMLWPLTQGNWALHVCFFAFVSWLGAAWMAMASARLLPNGFPAWMPWAVGSSPSWLFWSSGMLKEALVAFGLGLFSIALMAGWSIVRKGLFLLGASIVLALSKFYMLMVLLFASFAAFWVVRFRWRPMFTVPLAFGCWICLLLFPVSKALEKKQQQFVNLANGGVFIERTRCGRVDTLRIDPLLEKRLVVTNGRVIIPSPGIEVISWVHLKPRGTPFPAVQEDSENWRLLSSLKPAGSRFSIPEWTSLHVWSNVKSTFVWMLNCFTRPWPRQCRGFLDWVNLAESWLLLGALIWSLKGFKSTHPLDEAATAMVWVWCLSLALLVGISTPVVGALVRYRAAMHPAIMLLFFRAWLRIQHSKVMVKAPKP